MKRLKIETKVVGNFQEVFQQFNVKLFKALKPPGLKLEVLRFDGSQKGHEVHLKLGQLGLWANWISIITESVHNENECYFIDEGRRLPPPLKNWKHKHLVRKLDENTSLIIDDISYSCHGGIITENMMWPILWAQFSMRAPVYRQFFSSDTISKSQI